jgi:hypothetical protein
MNKFWFGFVVGALIAFVLGFNFGRDVPLWSNPFAATQKIKERVVEGTEKTLDKAKGAIHDATKPDKQKP